VFDETCFPYLSEHRYSFAITAGDLDSDGSVDIAQVTINTLGGSEIELMLGTRHKGKNGIGQREASMLAQAPSKAPALRAAFPNPTRDALTIRFECADPSPVTIELLDLAGRRVLAEEVSGGSGRRSAVLHTASLRAGTYVVSVRKGEQAATRLVSVVR
jgi:hypothetical protein